MTALEARGIFWWDDEKILEGYLAPDAHVAGRCVIEHNGRIVLELDGCLSSQHGPMGSILSEPIKKNICGLLKDSDDRIYLCDLFRTGGTFRSNGLSYEKFVAANALIGSDTFQHEEDMRCFHKLYLPLNGYEDWLRLGGIKYEHAEDRISVQYEKPSSIQHEHKGDSISITFSIACKRPGIYRMHSVSLKESATVCLQFNSSCSLSELQEQHGMLLDFLKLLTNSDHRPDWPTVEIRDGTKYKWYFYIGHHNECPPLGASEMVTTFLEIRDQFGQMWSDWKQKREKYGPGYYLYFGTRRGLNLYQEHCFVNLIWGVESLHRRKFECSGTAGLEGKIARILGEITRRKDREWLQRKLANAHEPSLEQRIFDVFSELPIEIHKIRLRAFAKSCADRRHEISHFGGQRHPTRYSDFVRDLAAKNRALSYLYHFLLLQEIGVSDSIIKSLTLNSCGTSQSPDQQHSRSGVEEGRS